MGHELVEPEYEDTCILEEMLNDITRSWENMQSFIILANPGLRLVSRYKFDIEVDGT